MFGVLISGCGGGSGSGTGGGGTTNSPDYSLSVQPSSITLSEGSGHAITVSVQPQNGFGGAVTLSLTGLSAGLTAVPSSFTIQTSGSQIVTLSASGTAAVVNNSSAIIQSSSGALSHQSQLAITVTPASVVSLRSRSRYLRTDSTTPFTSYPPPNWTVFHSSTKRFFASDPYTNHVNVIDSVTQKQIAILVIPGAFGMDQAADGSVLYVGTMIGDLYVVDPVQLTVVKRYPASSISPYGFEANAVYALANGKLLLERYFLVPGYSWVDGNGPIALWDPSNNSIVKFVDPQNLDGLMPEKASCLAGFEYGVLTNNRSRILLTPTLTSEGSSVLCSLDPVAGTWVWSATLSDGNGSALASLAISPDGNTVVASTGARAYVLDAATLQLKKSFPTQSTQSLFNYPSVFIGSDNQTLYAGGGSFIYAYNISTGALTGWLPNVQLAGISASSPNTPYMQSMSDSGLIAGVMDQGVALLDTNALNSTPVGTPFGPAQLSQTHGPVNGGTSTSWWQIAAGPLQSLPLGSTYFGSNLATGLSLSATGNPTLSATSPSGSPGPVDVLTLTTDGGEQILPEAFSYGPWVIEGPTTYATAEGGGPAQIYGYGFGPATISNLGQPSVAPPTDLQIQVGSGNAQVTGYLPEPYLISNSSSPFPLVGATFKVPPGAAGTSADVTVTNTSGSTTVKQGITYLPPVQSFPVSGGKLMDGVYDPRRDVYYFTDTNQIRVFSRAQGKWLHSIVVPSPVGAYGSQRLLGITLSLDGSKMVVSDAGAIAIYIIDPDNPASIKSYPFASQVFGDPVTETPSGVAITNSGIVYMTTFDLNGDGSPFLLTLDPSTGKVLPFAYGQVNVSFSTQGPYQYGRLPMSTDGSRIYVNSYGTIAAISTASGAITYPFGTNDLGQTGYEIVLAPNQTSLFADGFMMDSNMNILGLMAMNWREAIDADPVYGATMSPDGGLLFQPNSQSIDVFDGMTGAFRSRISLPITLSSNYRALVSDGKDDVQIAITGAGDGIAIIDLGSLPEPNPIPYFIRSLSDANLSSPPQGHAVHTLPRKNSVVRGVMPEHRVQTLTKSSPAH